MNELQARKGTAFKDLHTSDGIFVMPNAWNAGSACMLEAAGFPAIGTTSAGIAFSMGLPDYEGALTRAAALEETRKISSSVKLPVSADAENGYGHDPSEVAESIQLFAAAGAVGASIEDYAASFGSRLYDRTHATERIRAARETAESLDFPFTLTARAECYLVDHSDPFNESVERANLYRQAGADCLFVPGVKDAETIGALVREIDGPINVVMGLSGNLLTLKELESLGVKRVSIGGSLARATFGLIQRAATEIREQGTFTYSKDQIPDESLCQFFLARISNTSDSET